MMKTIPRNHEILARELLQHFPVISILGSRQSGKTTLAQQLTPDWTYLDLEKPSDYARLMEDPELFFRQHAQHVILDEAQKCPAIFEILRGIIDQDRMQKGRFILTGSSSPELQKHLSESLAGRIATIELPTLKANEYYRKPLSIFYSLFENPIQKSSMDLLKTYTPLPLQKMQHMWLYGGYPEPVLSQDLKFYNFWMESYESAYLNRDIAHLFPKLNTLAYQRFLSILCHLSGNILNKSDIARSLGISEKSVREYLQIAAGTFLWRELPSFEHSKIKAVTKLPKGHIRDSGLLHYLLHIDSLEALYRHPIIGRSFESFVIEEILKGLSSTSTTGWKPYYYRTRAGVEIDLILEGKFGILPIEIKHGSNTPLKQLRHLEQFITDNELPLGILINQSEHAEWRTEHIFQMPIGYL